MTEETKSTSPVYEDIPGATVVYFDGVAANGVLSGAIEVELAHRILVPSSNGVIEKYVTSGRLRTSPAGAQHLITALQNSLNMLQQSQEQSASATKLN